MIPVTEDWAEVVGATPAADARARLARVARPDLDYVDPSLELSTTADDEVAASSEAARAALDEARARLGVGRVENLDRHGGSTDPPTRRSVPNAFRSSGEG